MKNQLQKRLENETESGKIGSDRDSMGSKYTTLEHCRERLHDSEA